MKTENDITNALGLCIYKVFDLYGTVMYRCLDRNCVNSNDINHVWLNVEVVLLILIKIFKGIKMEIYYFQFIVLVVSIK